jgi:Family of unknown function (DUF6325)
METGPIEYMVVGFPGNKFSGEIAPALADLVESGTIRIIDLTFISKDADGDVTGFEMNDMEPAIQDALRSVGAEPGNLLSEDDIQDVGGTLEPNQSAALLVWEDLWAARFAETMRNADGVLLDIQRVPHDIAMAAREYAAANA